MESQEKNDLVDIKKEQGGLHAIKGFAFQIKVFLYYAVKLEADEKIQFEVLEDVNIEKEKDLDKYEDSFRTIQCKKTNEVIQVKHTQIDKSKTKEILLNWILLELDNNYDISKYILFTVPAKKSKNYINKISAEELFDIVIETDETSPLSKKYQLKKRFENDFPSFEEIVNRLKLKCDYLDPEQIDYAIFNRAKTHLKAGKGITNTTYLLRIKALKAELTNQIIESANAAKSFTLEHSELMGIEEGIIQIITDKFPMPDYDEYIKSNEANLAKIADCREIRQLNYCGVKDEGLKMRLGRWMYYSDYRLKLMEMSRTKELGPLERIAYENFTEVKEMLQHEQIDEPFKRLTKTENKTNSYTEVEPIKKGVCIYLTKEKDKPEDIQISWKDDDNE